MTPQATHVITVALILALLAWRLYARIRRTIGRQRLRPVRTWVSVIVFPLLVILLALAKWTARVGETSLLCGVGLGVVLGFLGLRLTRFESTTEGLFYTPSAHLGVALSALLVCRIGYRFATGGIPGAGPAAPQGASLTPLTLLLVGTLAGYYVTYGIGLLRWAARARGALPAAAPSG